MKIKRPVFSKIIFCTLFVFIFIFAENRSHGYSWEKTFGGSATDVGESVQHTTDGGYIIAGYTDSFGSGEFDFYLIKTDTDGNEMWSKNFGGSGSETAGSVQQTNDGGYIIVGGTLSFGAGYYDVYLIKTDADGNEIWSKAFGGSGYDWGYSVQQTNDGGYIIAATTSSFGAGSADVFLIKTDALGNELWTKVFGGVESDEGRSVQQTTDGGFIISGTTASFGNSSDVYLIKTDSDGNKMWSKTFGGSAMDVGDSVQQTVDGGFIIAGYTRSFGAGGLDVYLIKTDTDGNKIWSKTFGGSGDEDVGSSVQQTTDGGYIIAGHTSSFGVGSYDVYLIYYKPTPTCNGEESTIVGTEGPDEINGTDGPDVIHGLGGNDIIRGLGGDDVICGGDAQDVIGAGSGNDIVLGEHGHDAIWGGYGDDILRGGDGNDSIYGGPGNDILRGNHGNDSLYGISGVDELYGGWGPNKGTIDNNDTCYDEAGTYTWGCEVFYEQ